MKTTIIQFANENITCKTLKFKFLMKTAKHFKGHKEINFMHPACPKELLEILNSLN